MRDLGQVEPVAGASGNASRSTADLIRHLHQLIEALDRRVPHVERAGEAQIAVDARVLRESALRRLRKLERTPEP